MDAIFKRLLQLQVRIIKLRPLAKTALVAAGYAIAFALASIAVDIRIALENPADVQGSPGMYAFGDGMYFLFAFSLFASLPTAAALWFLHRAQRFWSFLTACAQLLAATAVVAAVLYAAGIWLKTGFGSTLEILAAFSVLRLLLTPIFACAFLLCLLFAPDRRSRSRFILAMTTEGLCGAVIFVHLAAPFAHGLVER